MANSYVHASNFTNMAIDSTISQRVGIIDDTPQRRVWMATKVVSGANTGDLCLSSIYTTGNGPESITGTTYPLDSDFLTRTATFFDQSANPNLTASTPTVAAYSGSVMVVCRIVNTLTGINALQLRAISPTLFDTMVDGDFSGGINIYASATESLVNPVLDMGFGGTVHAAWIEIDSLGVYSIAYINTVVGLREVVYTADSGSTIHEVSLIADKDNLVHIMATLTPVGLSTSTVIYGKKDWIGDPLGGWNGEPLFPATVSNIGGLSVVLSELDTFYIGYTAGTPKQANLIVYNHVTQDTPTTVAIPAARGSGVNMVTMGIDEDNNAHMGWTEAGVDDRFFHADATSVFANQLIITYVGGLGGFDTTRIDLSATNQMAYFGAPAVGVNGKQVYRAILGESPRYFGATLDSSNADLPSYSIVPLNVTAFLPRGGMVAGSEASVTSSESRSATGGALVSPALDMPEYFKDEGTGGAVVASDSVTGIEYTEALSGGGVTLGTDSVSVILNFYGYIVDENTSLIELGGEAETESGDPPLGIQRSFALSDLICVYSGGSNNNNADLSIGGFPSVFEIQGSINNLFDDIEPEETEEDFTDYRAFYIFNDHPTESIYNINIWIREEAAGGADAEIGTDERNELQTITIDEDITSGYFKIQYEQSNPNGSGPVTVNFDPDLSVWATNLENALNNGVSDLGDVQVTVAALSTGVAFDVLFQGQNGKRKQELLAITENSLSPSCTITVAREVSGSPVNEVAVLLDTDTTAPSNVTFVTPTEDTPITIPKLRAGEGFADWIKRTAEAGTSAVLSDGLILRISVEPVA